jgi:NAD(P)-dependent dehydrogenase (short-subunit alcohol dehydrogenase family)
MGWPAGRQDTSKANSFASFAEALQGALQSAWQRESFDFLINNAGFDSAAPFEKTTEEAFDSLMNVHFKGVFLPRGCSPLSRTAAES